MVQEAPPLLMDGREGPFRAATAMYFCSSSRTYRNVSVRTFLFKVVSVVSSAQTSAVEAGLSLG